MRKQFRTILAASRRLGTAALLLAASISTILPLALSADDLVATSADCIYAADTTPSPHAVKTAVELDEITGGMWKVAWCVGETVMVVAPDGTVTTLVSNAAAAGTATLALGSGGRWVLSRSRQGMLLDTVEFTVRYSLYGSAGSGTEADPLKVVDAEEIAEIGGETAMSGLHIALRGVDGLDLSTLVLGSGLSLTELGEGVWRIDMAMDGRAATSAAMEYPADSMQGGPDRKTSWQASPPVSYSGDNWIGDAARISTLTLTSPRGVVTTLDLTGTGALWFSFDEVGRWDVRLAMTGGAVRDAVILVRGGFLMSIR